MGRRDMRRAEKRHGEALALLEKEMAEKRFHQALETMRRILGDLELPPEIRVKVSVKQGKALVGIGRITEAMIVAERAERCRTRHGLAHLESEVDQLVTMIEAGQVKLVGGLGV